MSEGVSHLVCRRMALDLPWLANGSLAQPKAREVREHLIRCSGCRRELRETRAVLAMHHAAGKTSRRSNPSHRASSRSIGSFRRSREVLQWAAAVVVLLGGGLALRSLAPDLEIRSSIESSASATTAVERDTVSSALLLDDFESRALGNWSLPGDGTALSVFEDGFESWDLSKWSSSGAAIRD